MPLSEMLLQAGVASNGPTTTSFSAGLCLHRVRVWRECPHSTRVPTAHSPQLQVASMEQWVGPCSGSTPGTA